MIDVPSDILVKLERYCAYQERCEADVRKKMVGLAISSAQREEIMRRLIDQKFVDDARFAALFVRGKMRENQWGRLKIRQGLYAKGVDSAIIDQAIADIDPEEYSNMLAEAVAKWKRLNKEDAEDRSKLIRALLTKGFEMGEIMAFLNA
ncbi:MAG: RecX family transcriptional regulator [Bacteroidales bacterium]|nr:RecX family transcriptional regulator [Bacteroidales bacterium]